MSTDRVTRGGSWLSGVLVSCLIGAGALLVLSPLGAAPEEERKVPIPGLAAECSACHAQAAEQWATSIHRRTVGAPHIPKERQACAACHKGAAEHLADVTDEAKRPSIAGLSGDGIAEICLSCHRGGQRLMWGLSSHTRVERACLSCHDPHGGTGTSMLRAPEPELCQQCHPREVAEGLMPSHHPIREGKMVCTDCHNVHGDERGNLPEASTGEMCYRCHGEKEGPFLHEHPPVTEDCSTCHKPHGSQNDNLLAQDEPMLCLQCHPGHHDDHRTPLVSLDPNDPANAQQAILGFYGRCTSCHSRIHGTDLSSGSGGGTFMPGRPLDAAGQTSSVTDQVGAASTDPSLWGFGGVDFGFLDEDDNPTYVREYDGRDYDAPGARLEITQFGARDDFRLEATDLLRGDQDVSLRLGSPNYDLQVRHSGLTHRLGRYNDIEGSFDIPQSGGRLNAVGVTDLTEGKSDYQLERSTLDIRLAARCPQIKRVKWIANYWREAERGDRQFLFLERCNSCHKIQTTEPVDRVTESVEGGVEIDLDSAVFRYLRGQREFNNRASESYYDFPGVSSVYAGMAPLFGVPNTKTTSNDLRLGARLGEQASATALWRTKERDNLLGGGRLDVRSRGGGLSWKTSRDLRVSASFISRDLDVERLEEGVSRDRDTTRVDLRFTGLPHSTLSVGYQKEKVSRATEEPVDLIPRRSDSDIWRAGLVSRLGPRVSLNLQFRSTDTASKDFFDLASPPEHFPSRLIGLPTDGKRTSGILSYDFSSRTLLSALYSKRHDTYEVSVPGLAVSRASEEEIKTSGAQLAHSAGRRTRVTAGYYHQEGRTRTDTTYGVDDFTLSPPLVPTDIVFPFLEGSGSLDYDATIQTLDASVRASRQVRFFGSYRGTRTDGKEVAYHLGDYLDQNPDLDGVDLELNPFDIDIADWWLGTGYLVEPDAEVTLSYQRRNWENAADRAQDGSYSVWRLGFRRKF